MKTIGYLVTNSGSSPISVVGRRRLEIPAHCKDKEYFLPDSEQTRAVIARLKRTYPLLKFELAPVANKIPSESEGSAPDGAALGEPAQASGKAASGSASAADGAPLLMPLEEFGQKATVERAGNKYCMVAVEGLEPIKVSHNANESPETAVARAYEVYMAAGSGSEEQKA